MNKFWTLFFGLFIGATAATVWWWSDYSRLLSTGEQVARDHPPKAVYYVIHNPTAKYEWEFFRSGSQRSSSNLHVTVFRDEARANEMVEKMRALATLSPTP